MNPVPPCRDRLEALFSELLSVGLLPRAVLRKRLWNIISMGIAVHEGATLFYQIT